MGERTETYERERLYEEVWKELPGLRPLQRTPTQDPSDALSTGGHRWNQILFKRDADGRPDGVVWHHEKKAHL
jgi:hypothetical protein